ncbi:MAG: CRTAC1 family protein [Myxococcales bacterium]|nr:CRTAC1 family protein [Myxococcales bacterium]
MTQRLSWLVALSSTLSALGCSSGPDDATGNDPPPTDVPEVCDAHALTGTARFIERSADWGLSAKTAQAWVLTSVDLNGDGYLDLIGHVPAGSVRGKADGDRYYTVLLNLPKPGGGRHFVDRTVESGYGATRDGAVGELRVASGAVFGDVDNDGDLDVLSLSGGGSPKSPPTPADLDRTELLLNDGNGTLSLAPDAGVRTEDAKPVWSATLTDFDLDGSLDAFFANWLTPSGFLSEQQLLRGNGKGAFSDVSGTAGLMDSSTMRGACGVTACDLDDDGAPEIAVSAYGRMPNMLLKSDGKGGYFDTAVSAGFAYDQNVDYHDDQAFLCYCASNPTEPDCAGAASPMVQCAGVPKWSPGYSDQPEHLGGNTFTTVCSDITGDGKLDLFNAEIKHWWAGQASDPSALLVNQGNLAFDRPSRDQTGMHWEHVGVSWDEGGIDATTGDLDNDGREEVVVGRSDYSDQYAMIFHQLAAGSFLESAKSLGIDHPCAASPIVADFDRDGDLDVVMASSRMRQWCADAWERNEIRFYENDASKYGGWLAVRLVGDGITANRSAIGAKVVVDAGGTKITKVVQGAYGHGASQQDTIVFFGLGACTTAASIEVRWPNQARSVERWEKVTAGRVIELAMGDPKVREPLAP